MTRTSCIVHPPKQAIAIVRQDYYELMERDACAAALLNIFEYWANAAVASDVSAEERPWVGARPIREFEQMLLGIATDKQIRKRLVLLEARGFIQTKAPTRRGAAKEYRVLIPEIQQALVGQITELEISLRSDNQRHFGQMTQEDERLRLNDPPSFGQITGDASVKQPVLLRSNDQALKKKPKEFKKEDLKEARLSVFGSGSEEAAQVSHEEQMDGRSHIQTRTVQYAQSPETIDLADIWDTNPAMAKAKLRLIAPGHKRLEMVARGFGQWWIGPGLNDFDARLVQACRNRKRKCQQPSGEVDAKTYINNMLRNGDWGNIALRCEEAQALKQRSHDPVDIGRAC